MPRHAILMILFSMLAASCATPADVRPKADATLSTDDQIRAAVFTHLFGNNGSGIKTGASAYFLQLTDENDSAAKRDPSEALLAHFRGSKPPVRPASTAEHGDTDARDGVFDPLSKGPALIFFVGPVRRANPEQARVSAGYYEASLSASNATYWLAKTGGGWQVVKVTNLEMA